MLEVPCTIELVEGRDVNEAEPDGKTIDERSRGALEDLDTLIRRVTLKRKLTDSGRETVRTHKISLSRRMAAMSSSSFIKCPSWLRQFSRAWL